MRVLRVLIAACAGLLISTEGARAQQWTHEISDGNLTVRIDADRGGAITDILVRTGNVMTGGIVDNGDQTGRQIQASFYQGWWPGNCFPCNATCTWGYNPVQAGNACQQHSGGTVLEQTGTHIVTQTQPLQWNNLYNPNRSNVTLRQTIDLIQPFVARIEYRVTNNESFAWDGTPHEFPVAYLNQAYGIGYAYTRPSPFTYDDLTMVPIGTNNLSTTEPWIALSNMLSVTLGLYVPGKYSSWTIGLVENATLMQAWISLPLNPGETRTQVVYLIGGSTVLDVRSRVYALAGYGAVPLPQTMQRNSAVRGCSNWTWWNAVPQPDATSCTRYCTQNGANACEWYAGRGGECYVEFGNGCYVQSGFDGWSAIVFDGGSGGPQMQANSAVTGCSNWTWWNPVYKPDSGACLNYCVQNNADACEWNQNGECYVEFGNGCSVSGGYYGWYAAVLH